MPSAEAFFQQIGPALDAYGSGDHEEALAIFMSAVSGLDWAACKALLDEHAPGAVAQAIKDADTFFGVELPALAEWAFGPEQATAIRQPVLSVLGTDTARHVGHHRGVASGEWGIAGKALHTGDVVGMRSASQ